MTRRRHPMRTPEHPETISGLPRAKAAFLDRLETAGLPHDDAVHWLDLTANTRTLRQEVLDTARGYHAAGIPGDRARAWFDLATNPAEAQTHEVNGWYPDHLWHLRHELHILRHPDGRSRFKAWLRPAGEADWMATEIDPNDLHLFIRAGHNPAAARMVDERRRAGDASIEPALRALAALRNPHPLANPTATP